MSSGETKEMRVLVASAAGDELDAIETHLARVGADVVSAAQEDDIWRMLQQQTFDLLLIDLETPGVAAANIISVVRQQPRTRHLPIIVIAHPDATSELDAVFAAGAGSVLTKPVHWTVFEHHLGVALRMVAASARLRSQAHQAVAGARASEALLGNVCSEVRIAASVVEEQVERIWRALPAAAATPAISESLRRIGREAGALHEAATRAEQLADDVRHALVVVDRRERIDVLIERALDSVEMEAAERGVRLVSDLPEDDIVVVCDPGAIEQALRNIVHNAILYSPSDSNVSISVSVFPDGVLAIDVTDEGEGMHPEYVARCLTPLKASSAGVAATGRLGFGLPLAKAIMEAHDGALELRSMPAEGTTALLILPAERVVLTARDETEPS